MSEPLLSIRNHHAVACGDPPIIVDDDPDVYIGYFANPFGEQWVFTYHRQTRQANLRGGDVGWNQLHEVRDGTVPGLILGREESMWLAACWSAARGGNDASSSTYTGAVNSLLPVSWIVRTSVAWPHSHRTLLGSVCPRVRSRQRSGSRPHLSWHIRYCS